MEKNTKKKSSG